MKMRHARRASVARMAYVKRNRWQWLDWCRTMAAAVRNGGWDEAVDRWRRTGGGGVARVWDEATQFRPLQPYQTAVIDALCDPERVSVLCMPMRYVVADRNLIVWDGPPENLPKP